METRDCTKRLRTARNLPELNCVEHVLRPGSYLGLIVEKIVAEPSMQETDGGRLPLRNFLPGKEDRALTHPLRRGVLRPRRTCYEKP